MKFGVREICDVVLKAKATTVIGNKKFYANEPVIYFDTLKTSSMEGAATTVYAQGGRGNSRLVAWEGERTVTFTMEDALISPEGFMILSGAGLVAASEEKPIYQHMTETIDAGEVKVQGNMMLIPTAEVPYLPEDDVIAGNYAYVMFIKDGEIISEPYIPVHGNDVTEGLDGHYLVLAGSHDNYSILGENENELYKADNKFFKEGKLVPGSFDSVLIDYYVARTGSGVQQIEITADKFGGNYYLEASTLFRDQRGVDMPAEFIIPNCKIQSNFTFTMASSGDPSTFTFTMDAFPDYTRFDRSKKVLAAIQIIKTDDAVEDYRKTTDHAATSFWA
jgi:hypothetical protein